MGVEEGYSNHSSDLLSVFFVKETASVMLLAPIIPEATYAPAGAKLRMDKEVWYA